jgi:NADH:ubiquinone oxidoreductase subunit 6 (subunit J)
MFLVHLVVALLVALFLSLLLIPLRRPRSAQAKTSTAVGVLFLFFILFLGTWAGGLWITPFGSPWLGVYWMPFLVAGLFVALLVAATDQSSRRSYERKKTESDHVEHAALATAFGLLFWILIMALVIAIFAGYSAM